MSTSTVHPEPALSPASYDITANDAILDDQLVALMLQLEESGVYGQNGKGKFPAGDIPDAVIPFDCFEAEIEAHLSVLKDMKLARSIAQAVNADADAIAILATGDEQVHEDREYALHLSAEYDEFESWSFMTSDDDLSRWFETTPELQILEDLEETSAGPSTSYAERQASAFNKLSQQSECSVCFETFYATSIVQLPCRDRYCVGCLKELFLRATRDEGAFPPRCCSQAISIDLISTQLSETELDAFRKAEIEYTSRDRTYCSKRRCGAFTPPDRILAGKATCTKCGEHTCAMCKTEFHEDDDCPADEDLLDTLELAGEKGWQRCRSCRQMVELDTSCNHMM
jgi:hypothetical protein